jgi:CheY-like chemotaxis protein
VASGVEALERFRSTRPDLVLADVVMPPPAGYELCRRVKESDRPVPVLLLSGAFEPFDAEEATACGADGHLVKPFESQKLIDRVASILESGIQAGAMPGPEEAAEGAFDDLVASPDRVAGEAPQGTTAAETVEDLADEVGETAASEENVPESRAADGPAVRVPVLGIERGEGVEVPVHNVAVTDGAPAARAPVDSEAVETIVRAVLDRLSDRVVREIAWEVVPDLARILIRQRIREIEEEERGES